MEDNKVLDQLQDTTGAQETEVTEDKTFTQADVDKIVNERLGREKRKYSDYYQLKEQVETLKSQSTTLSEMSQLLTELNIEGTPAQQINVLCEHYGLTRKQAERAVNTATDKTVDDTKAFVNATRFERKASDDDVVEEIERILEIPANKRNEEDTAKLEILESRYSTIKFKADFKEADEWFKANCDGDIQEMLASEEFKEFADGSNAKLKTLIQRYVKFTGKGKKETKPTANPGSVKDTGSAVAKEFYTKDEVEKMTPSEIEKHYKAIQKSIPKW